MRSTPVSTEPRLSVRGLDVAFHPKDGPPVFAVQDVSLDVAAGEVLAIVGESGAGKSSIGHALMALVDPPGRMGADAMLLDGEPLRFEPGGHVRGRDISVIFQDPLTSLNPLFTVEQQLVDMVRHHLRLDRRAATTRAVEMLEEVGIPDAARRVKQYPHQFSGGMRQRVVIALALACRPRVVIADEPTSALDVSVQSQILELIRRLGLEQRMATLLITHDMGAVAQIADRVAVMRAGRIVETDRVEQVLRRPGHAYSRALIAAVPPPDHRIDRFMVPNVVDVSSSSDLDAWLRAGGGNTGSDVLVRLSAVTKRFVLAPGVFGRGARQITAVDEVSLTIGRSEIVGLVGESGSGKSTLAQVVAGLHRPSAGEVAFNGRTFGAWTPPASLRAYRRGLQMIFQDPFSSLNRRLSVGMIVGEPIQTLGLADSARDAVRIVSALLERVGLPPDAVHRHPHAFSGGQRQRIAIARALAARPRFLICDEPTSSLDVSIQAQILNLLKDLRDDLGLAMLFITHDLAVVRQMCDRIGVMSGGRLVELEASEDLFEHPANPYTRELIGLLPDLAALDAVLEPD